VLGMNGLPYGRLEYTTILFAHTRSKDWIQLVHLHSSLASLPRWCRLFLMASGRTRILCADYWCQEPLLEKR